MLLTSPRLWPAIRKTSGASLHAPRPSWILKSCRNTSAQELGGRLAVEKQPTENPERKLCVDTKPGGSFEGEFKAFPTINTLQRSAGSAGWDVSWKWWWIREGQNAFRSFVPKWEVGPRFKLLTQNVTGYLSSSCRGGPVHHNRLRPVSALQPADH